MKRILNPHIMRIFTLMMALLSAICMTALSTDNPTIINGQASKWALYLSTNSKLPNNIVNALTVDAKHNLWIGTENGLAMFKDTIVKVYHTGQGLPGERVTCLTVDDLDFIWIGTFANGIGKYKESANVWSYYSTSTTPALPHNYVTSIAQVNSTQFWIGTRGGVAQLLGSIITPFTASNSDLNTNYINCIGVTSNGAKWIGTDIDGVWKHYNGVFTQYNTTKSSLPNNFVRSIFIDQLERIYFGTDGGVAIFENPTWTIYSKANSNIPSNRVYCLMKDYGDNLWVGTDAGVARFDGKTWITYNVANTGGGIPANAINAIEQDDSMYIWVATGSGLSKLVQRSFNQCENDKVCSGGTTFFEVKKTISYTATYQWQVNIGGGWADVKDEGVYSGSTTNKLYLTGVGGELNNAQYRCAIVYNTIGKDTTNAITLTVNPLPNKPTITVFGDKIFTEPAATYQWYYASGDIKIDSATKQSHTPGLTTQYYVVVTNVEGCPIKSDPFLAQGNALDENAVQMSVYPNPSKGKFTINGSSWLEEIHSISIINSKGTLIHSESNLKLMGSFTKEFDLNAPSGNYFIKITTSGGNQKTYQLIIQK